MIGMAPYSYILPQEKIIYKIQQEARYQERLRVRVGNILLDKLAAEWSRILQYHSHTVEFASGTEIIIVFDEPLNIRLPGTRYN
jgi:hypothetical protein